MNNRKSMTDHNTSLVPNDVHNNMKQTSFQRLEPLSSTSMIKSP